MMKFSDEELVAFCKVYMQRYAHLKIAEGVDLHQDFANELGIPRQEAKVLCHKINYTLDKGVF